MFTEAATSYIKMTNELSDLRSALLLEQAAYCFLLAQPASTRKYGFHIVLAGYRFSRLLKACYDKIAPCLICVLLDQVKTV